MIGFPGVLTAGGHPAAAPQNYTGQRAGLGAWAGPSTGALSPLTRAAAGAVALSLIYRLGARKAATRARANRAIALSLAGWLVVGGRLNA